VAFCAPRVDGASRSTQSNGMSRWTTSTTARLGGGGGHRRSLWSGAVNTRQERGLGRTVGPVVPTSHRNRVQANRTPAGWLLNSGELQSICLASACPLMFAAAHGHVRVDEMSPLANCWTTSAGRTRYRRRSSHSPGSSEGVAPQSTPQRLYFRGWNTFTDRRTEGAGCVIAFARRSLGLVR
jgi:hypothetical protein